MTTPLPCPFISLPVGCTDPKCPHLHPPGYRTRCRNTARPGGCQNQYCRFYHHDYSEVIQAGHQEERNGWVEKTSRVGSSQQRCSSQGSTGVSLRSYEDVPLYDQRNRKDRDLWSGREHSADNERRKGFAGQSGGGYDPYSEVEGERKNGRKWEICDRKYHVNFDQQERNGNHGVRNGSFHNSRNEIEIGEVGGQQDEFNQSLGIDRQVAERGNFSEFEDENNINAKYNYRDRQQGFCTGNREGGDRKPNIVQQNQRFSTNSKKRYLGSADPEHDADSGQCYSKKLKEDIDLRLDKANVETFDFPENLIGLLMGKKGATINRMKAQCSPAVITVPQDCDARGFRAVRIEGYRVQIEKAKSVIYKMFKERRIENIVDSFKRFAGDLTPMIEENKCEDPKFLSSHQDSGNRGEIEVLKTKLGCLEREKVGLQNQVSKLTSINSELVEGKYKLQGQVFNLNEEVEGQRVRIQSLELENKNLRMEKDFSEAADDSWKNISIEQTKQLNFQIETLAKELVKNNKELKARDDIINDLEQTSETRLEEIRQLQSEMERDFIECDKCDEKFRSNELLRRHMRFKH